MNLYLNLPLKFVTDTVSLQIFNSIRVQIISVYIFDLLCSRYCNGTHPSKNITYREINNCEKQREQKDIMQVKRETTQRLIQIISK